MSRFRRFELVQQQPFDTLTFPSIVVEDSLSLDLDLLPLLSPFDVVADLENSGSSRKYTFQVQSGDAEKKKGNGLRIVEIQEPSDHRDMVLRQIPWKDDD